MVGLDFVLRAKAWGHEVKWAPSKKKGEMGEEGDGMEIDKVENWLDHIDWADIIIPTMNDKHIMMMDALREAGKVVFGPSLLSRELEVDREKGMDFLRDHGIEVPEYRVFTDYDQAIAYVKKMDEPFASKPLGDNPDKSLTYVAKSPEGLVSKLERWKEEGKELKKFMLQRKVDGTEFGVSRWMGKEGFVGVPNESFEYKKLMPGDKGVNTGETGTVIKYVDRSKIYDSVLKPLEKSLRKMGHTGDTAINCIIDKKGNPNVLEFTMRWGWPFMYIHQALQIGDPLQWMWDACKGKDTFKVSKDVAVGFLVWLPDFPYSRAAGKTVEGLEIYGITEEMMPNIHLSYVMWADGWRRGEDGKVAKLPGFSTTGDYTLVVTGTGRTVKVAREAAIERIEKIDIPNDPAWREDVGDIRLAKKITTLQSNDYAKEWTYQ